MNIKLYFLIFSGFISTLIQGQNQLRKTLFDKAEKIPVEYAYIQLNSEPNSGTISNKDGNFILLTACKIQIPLLYRIWVIILSKFNIKILKMWILFF